MTAPPFVATTHGILLRTGRFERCVEFYETTLGLPVRFRKPGLVCFRFGDGYLMVETGGVTRDGRKGPSENPAMLRFNVVDVEKAAASLARRGVEVEIKRYDWGTVATFFDPDGNPCELKNADDPLFTQG